MILSLPSVRWWRRAILGLLVVPLAVTAGPKPDLPPLPEDLLPVLRPYLEAALAQSPQMIISNINIATAEASRIQSYSGLWPSLGGSASYSANKATVAQQTSVSSTSSGVYYSLGLSQPIFQWGSVKNRALSGKIGLQVAEHQYAEAYRTLVVTLRSQFLALVQKRIALRNAEFALKQAEEGLTLAEAQLKAGRISPEAMMAPRMAVDESRLGRDRALEDLENSKRLFLLSVGRDDLDNDGIPLEIPRPTYAPELVDQLLQEFLRSGADRTFTAVTYHDYIRLADIDYRIARVNLLPKFSFSAGVSQANVTSASSNFVSQVGVFSTYWNLVGSWTLFDGFATRGAKRSALDRRRSYERTLRTLTDQTMAAAQDLVKQMSFAWRGTQINETYWSTSMTRLERLQDDLKRGRASQTAVNAALQNTYQYDLTLCGSRGQFLDNWSQFVSTLCIDPMLNLVPGSYLKDGK